MMKMHRNLFFFYKNFLMLIRFKYLPRLLNQLTKYLFQIDIENYGLEILKFFFQKLISRFF